MLILPSAHSHVPSDSLGFTQGSRGGFWRVEGKKGDEFWGRTGKGGAYGVWEQMACLFLSLFGDVRWELERPLGIPLEARDR